MKYLNVPDLRLVLGQASLWVGGLGVLAAYTAVNSGSPSDALSLGILSGGSLAVALAALRMATNLDRNESDLSALRLKTVPVRDLVLDSRGSRGSRAAQGRG